MPELLALLALAPAACLASEQQLYFHLHQSYELLEAFRSGKCPSAREQVRRHLEAADGELGKMISADPRKKNASAFEPGLHKLWRLFRALDRIGLAEVEAVRAEVQSSADALGLRHEKKWHDELKSCLPFEWLKASGRAQ